MKKIPFSPPDINQDDINEVIDTLNSGWITTGPKAKELEDILLQRFDSKIVKCISSATSGLELILKIFSIGEGDEVITSAYTYSATINAIISTGATPVLVDTMEESFNIDPHKIDKAITKNTKAIIPIDIGGFPCNYKEIYEILNKNKNLFFPREKTLQTILQRPLLISDSAHSLGAIYNKKDIGSVSDFNIFSFHAVKNLTTAEGGAISCNIDFDNLLVEDFKVFNNKISLESNKDFYKLLSLSSLHGQSKDAFSKFNSTSWKYDIVFPGMKCNMSDIHAALGLSQVRRYDKILSIRKKLFNRYIYNLKSCDKLILPKFIDEINDIETSYHLFQLRIKEYEEVDRDKLINKLNEQGISTNVHFIPIPLMSGYKYLNMDINNYPNTYKLYKQEITLPLYSTLKIQDVDYICDILLNLINQYHSKEK